MYSKEPAYGLEQQQEIQDGGVETNGLLESTGVGVRCTTGSLGSLGGPRAMDVMYDGHGSMTGVPVSALSAAQTASLMQQQQQQQVAAANVRYYTMQPQMNHHMSIPSEYMHGYQTTGGNHVVTNQPVYSNGNAVAQRQASFDRCPAVCSLFAIFCCPITCWCSLPALVYSIWAYTDYRAADMQQYRSKSDVARRLVIIACIIGLILCVCWAVLTFFYYDVMLNMLGEIITAVQRNLRFGS